MKKVMLLLIFSIALVFTFVSCDDSATVDGSKDFSSVNTITSTNQLFFGPVGTEIDFSQYDM